MGTKVQLKRYDGSDWVDVDPVPADHTHEASDIVDGDFTNVDSVLFHGDVKIEKDKKLDIVAGNTDLDFLRLRYDDGSSYGWVFKYRGDLSGNDNRFEIHSSDHKALQITQDGVVDFNLQPKYDGDVLATEDYVDNHKQDDNNPHNVTASQVGARPDDWMPSASDVGAAEDDHSHSEYLEKSGGTITGDLQFDSALKRGDGEKVFQYDSGNNTLDIFDNE